VPLPGIEPRLLGGPSRSLVAILTEVSSSDFVEVETEYKNVILLITFRLRRAILLIYK
jgi:hypothetical protein